MPHARRHPAPPHLACFIIVPADIHGPHTRESQFRRQHCNVPRSTRLMSHAQRHPIPTSRTCPGTAGLQNIGLPQGWPDGVTTTPHARRGSCWTPEGTQLHPTLHALSSYRPSTIPKAAQVRRQHRNSPIETRLTLHARRRARQLPRFCTCKFRHRNTAVNRRRPSTTPPTPQAYAHVRRIVLGAWGWRRI